MKQQIIHNGLQAVDEQSKRFFTGGEFEWKKSEAVIWNEIELTIDQHSGRIVPVNFNIVKWAVAAVLITLIGMGVFMRQSITTVKTQTGEHFSMTLPDGSAVDLNAESTLSYHKYWWRFDRKVNFEGEGFFSVQKGKRFRVVSEAATTEVLGTRFNVFSRENSYRVTCVEGSVKVVSSLKHEAILKPNDKATVKSDGTILTMIDIEPLPEISWKDYTFFFTAIPLGDVFSEIERQYGVTINVKVNVNARYTGNFSKNQNIEEVLGYICPAMGFKFIRQSSTAYSVIDDPQ